MAAGLQQAFRSDAMSKPLHAGHAAEAGLLAAFAAGATGSPAHTTSSRARRGSAPRCRRTPTGTPRSRPWAPIRGRSAADGQGHACCGHTFAAIDAALELRRGRGCDPDRIAAIEIATYSVAIKVTGNPNPTTEFEAKFSLGYCVAAALVQGSVRLAAFEPERLEDPLTQRLLARIDVRAAHDLTRVPGPPGRPRRRHDRRMERSCAQRRTSRGDPGDAG